MVTSTYKRCHPGYPAATSPRTADSSSPSHSVLAAAQFRVVMNALSAQVLWRAVLTLVLFVSLPLTLGILYHVLVDWLVDHEIGRGLPSWLLCAGSMFDALHLGPTVLMAASIPLLIPRVLTFADRFVDLAAKPTGGRAACHRAPRRGEAPLRRMGTHSESSVPVPLLWTGPASF